MTPSSMALSRDRSLVSNADGWSLALTRYSASDCLDPSKRPIVMVPGYAMNSFILSYHPTDISMIGYLVRSGFEVWTADLRGQGDSQAHPGAARRYGLAQLALVDLPCAIEQVRRNTHTRHRVVDLVGCSLGGSLVYAYLAHHPADHGVGAVITIGAPLRWITVHPALRIAFKSPRLAGLVPILWTRALARRALPLLSHVPSLLSIYMNARRVDLSHPEILAQTIDDPVPYINRQLARWIKDRDLVVAGLNVTEALSRVDLPVLVVLANRDGIVPPATARSICEALPPGRVDVLKLGEGQDWCAHADLFIGSSAPEQVFGPMVEWLSHHQAPS